MDLILFRETDASDSTGTELQVKQEPQSEFQDNSIIEPVLSVTGSDISCQRIKNELVNEEEKIENPLKKRRKTHRTNEPGNKYTHRNDKIEDRENRRSELTQLPCIVNISVLERPSQRNHSLNGTSDTSNGINSTSLQSSIPEKTSESNDCIAAVGQNSSNNSFTSKVYEVLVDIQSTLKDLKTEIAENSKKIDQLQKILPQPWSWNSMNSEFNFPVSTEEQLLELEKLLENDEMGNKLVVHLTTRTYTSWKEMVVLCMKYMISRNVALLYNLNGVKGTKKKFRDLKICRILVDCVQYKFKEATTLEILKRISFTLAGAGDWDGSRRKKK